MGATHVFPRVIDRRPRNYRKPIPFRMTLAPTFRIESTELLV